MYVALIPNPPDDANIFADFFNDSKIPYIESISLIPKSYG
jgi:hypothetical protein